MPGITSEWKLYSNDNNLNYYIRIFDFGHKMNTWRVGREVRSMPFQVGEAEFSIDIYPNGNTKENRGNISVFVNNKNNWAVKVDIEFSIGTKSLELVAKEMEANTSWGWPTYCDHDDARNLFDDGQRNLTASANIKLIWEEVTHRRKNMKAEVQVLNSEVTDLKRKIETLERTMVAKLEENPAKRKPTSPCPECPVCFDEMKPPTKIVQCMSGHLICLKCRDRPEVTCCPTCKQKFTGERAIGMENFLRTLFPEELL